MGYMKNIKQKMKQWGKGNHRQIESSRVYVG